MKVNGLQIEATPELIIEKLSRQLEDEGVFIFRRPLNNLNNSFQDKRAVIIAQRQLEIRM